MIQLQTSSVWSVCGPWHMHSNNATEAIITNKYLMLPFSDHDFSASSCVCRQSGPTFTQTWRPECWLELAPPAHPGSLTPVPRMHTVVNQTTDLESNSIVTATDEVNGPLRNGMRIRKNKECEFEKSICPFLGGSMFCFLLVPSYHVECKFRHKRLSP